MELPEAGLPGAGTGGRARSRPRLGTDGCPPSAFPAADPVPSCNAGSSVQQRKEGQRRGATRDPCGRISGWNAPWPHGHGADATSDLASMPVRGRMQSTPTWLDLGPSKNLRFHKGTSGRVVPCQFEAPEEALCGLGLLVPSWRWFPAALHTSLPGVNGPFPRLLGVSISPLQHPVQPWIKIEHSVHPQPSAELV